MLALPLSLVSPGMVFFELIFPQGYRLNVASCCASVSYGLDTIQKSLQIVFTCISDLSSVLPFVCCLLHSICLTTRHRLTPHILFTWRSFDSNRNERHSLDDIECQSRNHDGFRLALGSAVFAFICCQSTCVPFYVALVAWRPRAENALTG